MGRNDHPACQCPGCDSCRRWSENSQRCSEEQNRYDKKHVKEGKKLCHWCAEQRDGSGETESTDGAGVTAEPWAAPPGTATGSEPAPAPSLTFAPWASGPSAAALLPPAQLPPNEATATIGNELASLAQSVNEIRARLSALERLCGTGSATIAVALGAAVEVHPWRQQWLGERGAATGQHRSCGYRPAHGDVFADDASRHRAAGAFPVGMRPTR